MTARIERVATVLAAADAAARAMGLPDGFMQMAQALDDAGLLMPEALPDARLAEIASTIPSGYEGPWYFQPAEDGRRWVVGYPTDCPDAGLIATVPDYGMYLAEFIAAARNAVPELVAEVKRLRAEVERLTPKPKVIREPAARRAALLAAVVRQGGEWTPTRVERLYKQQGDHDIYRRVVRVDLAALHAAGHLVLHDDAGRRFYTPAKDGAE